ncbi:uncharacterized protein LAESUDRAFT_763017 [Laetiporus sulphureus 93-53]|uniref:Auxin efflux carrier n=1 Tax=Laetiporus sulphureus 93-53 TaxID=1314785 RepID=A0A165C5W9_9APHY|nr:uncharacterized protein LAESUDRAFT_763017 [Laetiporus sulphureus 93-53]KZT02260.1 hypothetical protein LAESUDRAFT_763017 [Laetiporus sulphureus 93-53]
MPLLKTYIAISVGYLLAQRRLFSADASTGASQVFKNICLPALIFSNVVPAFTSSNISALGPLFSIAFTYVGIGFLFGLLIREFFYVPRNFWQGIVVLCGMSNWGNLPSAIVSSIMTDSPINPDADPELGISYVAVFIVTYHFVFWITGVARSLSWDYLPDVPQNSEAERLYSWKEKPIGGFIARRIRRKRVPSRSSSVNPENVNIEADLERSEQKNAKLEMDDTSSSMEAYDDSRQPSVQHEISSTSPIQPVPRSSPVPESVETSATHMPPPPFLQRLKKALQPASAAVTPITCTLVISVPVSLIPDLKALFTPVTGGQIGQGRTGNHRSEFLGNMAVPLSLIILGASFARLKISRPFSGLPIMAMIAAAVAKMIVLPIIGIFVVQAMVRDRLIAKDALAERFVAMFLSGTPAAVNQLIVSNLYSTTGEVDTLSAFLLVQYVGMLFSST